jgi:hypothetical protein
MLRDAVKIGKDKNENYVPENKGISIGKTLLEPKMIKSKNPFYCLVCGEKRKAGVRYFGRDKVCQFCIEEWLNKSIVNLNGLVKTLKVFRKKIRKGWVIWGKEIIISNLFADGKTGKFIN